MPRKHRPKRTAADVLQLLAKKIAYDIHCLDKDSGPGAGVRYYAREAGVSEATVERFLEQAKGEQHAVHFETVHKLAPVVCYELRLMKRPLR